MNRSTRISESRRYARSGFTLVELIVATGITIAIAAIMVSITAGIMSAWNRSRAGMTSSNDIKLLQDQISADLEGVIMRRGGGLWFAATVQPDQSGRGDSNANIAVWDASGGGTMKPGNAATNPSLRIDPDTQTFEQMRFGQAGVWLRFFTSVPDSNDDSESLSAPRAVSYQIVRFRESDDSPIRYGMFRSMARSGQVSDSTFEIGYDLDLANYTNSSDGDLFEGDARTIRRPIIAGLAANNVIDFGIRAYRRDTEGNPILLFPTSDLDTEYLIPSEDDTPEFFEVFLRVLSDSGATEIEALETGKAAVSSWWDLATRSSRVIMWRVELKARTAEIDS